MLGKIGLKEYFIRILDLEKSNQKGQKQKSKSKKMQMEFKRRVENTSTKSPKNQINIYHNSKKSKTRQITVIKVKTMSEKTSNKVEIRKQKKPQIRIWAN